MLSIRHPNKFYGYENNKTSSKNQKNSADIQIESVEAIQTKAFL